LLGSLRNGLIFQQMELDEVGFLVGVTTLHVTIHAFINRD
jgi:hypothetical protein